ncbi:putative phosphoglycerate mutase [Paenibacillus cellulosilyticus]|uniref:Putative phosphoglycerate mutase n=1 Tax=Paenibacillus cellulosilyticus TaxID=375489 RepID=A0A2V2YKA1_9BACL|nr:histidine phosphatase family protein [Paenibacillus cellulosilyticus]PWV92493.1 putative phosphoglycerate mutase [Paenibacillus cellulosilyticus]QKS47063.1 histidine phosphatase family protein [Paenibacillus cellulosilyticus]
MRTFYLVRHALKEKDVGDVAITAEGRLQAEATGRFFKGKTIDAIVASPLLRTKQTAAYMALSLGLEAAVVVEDNRLRERANWGDLPGQSFDAFIAMWEQCTRDPSYIPPAGDSARQAGERFAAALLEIGDAAPHGSSVVIVTHGGVLTDFLVHYFDEMELNRWHPEFVAVQSTLVPECSITQITYDDGQFRIERFASVEHLNDC